MELITVANIRELRDSIRDKIKKVDKSNYDSTPFGDENEYSFKGLIGGIESLLTDISTFTSAPKKFVKISTYEERNNIVTNLKRIDTYFDNPANYISQFDSLKVLLRSYNVRYFEERHVRFEEEIDNILKTKLQLQDEQQAVDQIKNEIKDTNSSVEKEFESSRERLAQIEDDLSLIIERKKELAKQISSFEEVKEEILSIKEDADENLEKIKNSMTESSSNEKLIDAFASKVQERERRLQELEKNTEDNNTKLSQYEEERSNLLEEARQLIESAKKALNYKTAEGISASFQAHYNSSKSWQLVWGWIIGAALCSLTTIALGIWILQSDTSNIGLVIGRVSLLPLPIVGAIFCANQYTKQKNIIEDYAYKMVLAKAIVGFSEQLKRNGSGDNEEYVHYIKTALEEIHKDPLRRRTEKRSIETKERLSVKELVDIAERIVKISKINN